MDDVEALVAAVWLRTELRHNEARRAVLSAMDLLGVGDDVVACVNHYNNTHERQITC